MAIGGAAGVPGQITVSVTIIPSNIIRHSFGIANFTSSGTLNLQMRYRGTDSSVGERREECNSRIDCEDDHS